MQDSHHPWHHINIDEVKKLLSTENNGLTCGDVEERLAKHGHNELAQEKSRSSWLRFLDQFRNMLIIILIVASLASAAIGEAMDASVIILIVALNAIFGFLQENNAEKAMQALKKMAAPTAHVMRDNKPMCIPAKDIVPGDVLLLGEGDMIPADARLFEVVGLKVDEASLTGESVPVDKELCEVKRDAQIQEMRNMVWMGTVATYGRAKAYVVSTGMNTEMGKIAKGVQVEKEETPLQKKLEQMSRQIGVMVLVICAIMTVVGILRAGGISAFFNEEIVITMFITGVALAVAAIPEGLPAVLTITLALGMQRMAAKNSLVRHMSAVETLGSTTVICSDKTGTLTRNEMTITDIVTSSGRSFSVTGGGYRPVGDFMSGGRNMNPRSDNELVTLLEASVLCNNSSLSGETIIGDPTEGAMVVAAAKAGMDKASLEKSQELVSEIPFSSDRKMMTTIRKNKDVFYVYSKGAPEVILGRCGKILHDKMLKTMTPSMKEKILATNADMASRALRVLAVAYKKEAGKCGKDPENGMVFLGLVGMIDPPREEAAEAIKLCRKAGIRTVMITGDNPMTARAVAMNLGLFTEGDDMVTGADLEKMSDAELHKKCNRISVYSRVSPAHKMRIVEALRKNGHIIAMTGDGVNDAPALKHSDIGISMGIKGTAVAKEASDMVLRDDNFATIVAAVREGRTIYDNIKKFMVYILSSNLGEVLVLFIAIIIGFTDPATGMMILPLTAIQLLWINILTDGLPAIAIGVDPPAPGIMERPARDPKAKILDMPMMAEIIFVGVLICVGTLAMFVVNLAEGPVKATTAAFTTIVIFELANLQAIRMRYRMGIFENSKLLYSIIISVALQLAIIYVPLLQSAFGTTALNLQDWIEILAMTAGLMAVSILWFRSGFVHGKLARKDFRPHRQFRG